MSEGGRGVTKLAAPISHAVSGGGAASAVRGTAAGVATGKTLNDSRGTFATRLMHNGFEDREIAEILGWETGKSARIRRVYNPMQQPQAQAREQTQDGTQDRTQARTQHRTQG